jgi:hypothetical protein
VSLSDSLPLSCMFKNAKCSCKYVSNERVCAVRMQREVITYHISFYAVEVCISQRSTACRSVSLEGNSGGQSTAVLGAAEFAV